VLNRAFKHIRYSLDASVRMPWKAFDEICGPLVAKIIEQQKGVEFRGVLKTESAVQFDASAFKCGHGLACFQCWSKRHDASPK
jgi:hypothetical protein